MIWVHRSPASGDRVLARVQPSVCLKNRKMCSRSKRRRHICHTWSTSTMVAAVADHHSHSGFGWPSPRRWSTCSRITVPSMMGRSPSWSAQAPRRVSRGCSRSNAWATAVRYLVVGVVVVCAGSGQVWGSVNVNSAPWRAGRPVLAGGAAAVPGNTSRGPIAPAPPGGPVDLRARTRGGDRGTRPHPRSEICGSPGAQWPTSMIFSATARSPAAATVVSSSLGPTRPASRTAHQLLRPCCRAATTE